jgi:hypothetical protein
VEEMKIEKKQMIYQSLLSDSIFYVFFNPQYSRAISKHNITTQITALFCINSLKSLKLELVGQFSSCSYPFGKSCGATSVAYQSVWRPRMCGASPPSPLYVFMEVGFNPSLHCNKGVEKPLNAAALCHEGGEPSANPYFEYSWPINKNGCKQLNHNVYYYYYSVNIFVVLTNHVFAHTTYFTLLQPSSGI